MLQETPYSYRTRFENEKGTNPEELIAAAHAGCFTMALAFQLQTAGYTPTELNTIVQAKDIDEAVAASLGCPIFLVGGGADVPGLDQATFAKLAEAAEKNCPISRVLNAEITLDAHLK